MSSVRQLVLASRSPRRARLLRDAGFDFTQADPPFHDPLQPEADRFDDAVSHACDLAARKALSLARTGLFDRQRDAVILAADTIGVVDGHLIGQPRDATDALRMVADLCDREHDVVTGVALLAAEDREPQVLGDRAAVIVGHIPEVQLEAYIATGQWRGKAGGYNLFDRVAAGWPIVVHGDATTVVGLPMTKLVPQLLARGVPRSTATTSRDTPPRLQP